MITSPGFTSYEHWSDHNDDSANVVKNTPYRNPSTREGFAQAQFAHNVFAHNQELNDPESLLLAKERGYLQMLFNELNDVEDFSDYDEGISATDDDSDNGPVTSLHEEIHESNKLRIARNELNEYKNRSSEARRLRDGTRQLPAIKRDTERREVQKAA